MKVLAVLLNNYFPNGIINTNYINKIDIYDKSQNKEDLINKICVDLIQKLEILENDYIFLFNGKRIPINKDSIKNLIKQIITEDEDRKIMIHHKCGSAFGRYYLYVYSINLK